MILELVDREEALVLGDVKLLVGEEPVVVLGGHLSERPDKGHVLVLDVVIGSRITCSVVTCVCEYMCVLLCMIVMLICLSSRKSNNLVSENKSSHAET